MQGTEIFAIIWQEVSMNPNDVCILRWRKLHSQVQVESCIARLADLVPAPT